MFPVKEFLQEDFIPFLVYSQSTTKMVLFMVAQSKLRTCEGHFFFLLETEKTTG